MRKWEDIVKDKLEAPDGILPESVLDEFHSRLEAPANKQKAFPWVWVAIPALAAGLAAILLLRNPSVHSGGVQIVPQPTAPVAVVTVDEDESGTTTETETTTETTGSISPADSVKPADSIDSTDAVESSDDKESADAKDSADSTDSTESDDSTDSADSGDSNGSNNTDDSADSVNPEGGKVDTVDPIGPDFTSPVIPPQTKGNKVQIKVGPAAGIVSGGGLLAAAVTPFIGGGNSSSGEHGPFMGDPRDKLVEDPVHYFPIRVGLSAGIPISDRWFVSTGLNYSLYLSSFNYKIAGKTTQAVHYLGIPVKINWIMASNDLFDVYLGGGVEGDKCLGEDGFSLWLQGAGGIQMNLNPLLGIYLEPELSWRIPTGTPKLETYRSAHPLMFTVSGGLRFNIGHK